MALCPRVMLHEALFATAVNCRAGAFEIKAAAGPAAVGFDTTRVREACMPQPDDWQGLPEQFIEMLVC